MKYEEDQHGLLSKLKSLLEIKNHPLWNSLFRNIISYPFEPTIFFPSPLIDSWSCRRNFKFFDVSFFFIAGVIEATFNGSQSSVSFTNSTPFSNANPLVAQFRTRQNASSILVSVHNGTFFEVVIQEGHLVIFYNLEDNITRIVNTGR